MALLRLFWKAKSDVLSETVLNRVHLHLKISCMSPFLLLSFVAKIFFTISFFFLFLQILILYLESWTIYSLHMYHILRYQTRVFLVNLMSSILDLTINTIQYLFFFIHNSIILFLYNSLSRNISEKLYKHTRSGNKKYPELQQ